MHPAKSVIFFTTASGAGYGLFIALVFAINLGIIGPNPNIILLASVGSFLLVTLGLLSSTLHLGHPERAWRALSQWRSSWLSREGILAILTYGPAILYIYGLLYLSESDGWVAVMGWISALMCLLTVYATSMIYRTLKPIQAWSNKYTMPVYLLMSLTSGLIILNFLFSVYGEPLGIISFATLIGLLVTEIIKLLYWRFIDTSLGTSDLGTATGLGDMGVVTPLEKPHTEDNYLLKEMGFKIARRHSRKLRNLFLSLWIFSTALIAIPYFFTVHNLGLISLAALILASIATIIERWLFFAEAKHTVALYYNG